MSKLKEYTLKECIDKIIDYRGKTPEKMNGSWKNKGVRVISALNVHDGFIDNEDQIRYVDKDVYKKWMTEEIERNDLLLASEGASLGENCIWDSDEKIVLGQRLYAIRTNSELLDPWFFAMYMQSKKFKLQIQQVSTGSTVFGISQPVLMNLKILLPNIQVQKKIGKVFKDIRNRIIANNKINNNLEELAYIIFLQKFTQKIPNGTIGDFIKENGKSKIKVNDAKTVKGKYPFFTSGESILEWNDYLVEGRNLFFNTGGNADVKYYVGKAMYSTDTWCVTTNGDFSDYLYLYFKSIKGELDRKFFHGSGLKHLQKDLLKQEKIYIPEKEEISQFNILVKPMFDTISENKIENQRLDLLKGFILPLLMNGQINVDDIEI